MKNYTISFLFDDRFKVGTILDTENYENFLNCDIETTNNLINIQNFEDIKNLKKENKTLFLKNVSHLEDQIVYRYEENYLSEKPFFFFNKINFLKIFKQNNSSLSYSRGIKMINLLYNFDIDYKNLLFDKDQVDFLDLLDYDEIFRNCHDYNYFSGNNCYREILKILLFNFFKLNSKQIERILKKYNDIEYNTIITDKEIFSRFSRRKTNFNRIFRITESINKRIKANIVLFFYVNYRLNNFVDKEAFEKFFEDLFFVDVIIENEQIRFDNKVYLHEYVDRLDKNVNFELFFKQYLNILKLYKDNMLLFDFECLIQQDFDNIFDLFSNSNKIMKKYKNTSNIETLAFFKIVDENFKYDQSKKFLFDLRKTLNHKDISMGPNDSDFCFLYMINYNNKKMTKDDLFFNIKILYPEGNFFIVFIDNETLKNFSKFFEIF
ncbi:MAG: hypothetical protein NZZ41_00840 [Candidatus Dojkabacteria bacterium]|nr:hypothetical protein [Candidatus Dojkabacteria bacterium]